MDYVINEGDPPSFISLRLSRDDWLNYSFHKGLAKHRLVKVDDTLNHMGSDDERYAVQLFEKYKHDPVILQQKLLEGSNLYRYDSGDPPNILELLYSCIDGRMNVHDAIYIFMNEFNVVFTQPPEDVKQIQKDTIYLGDINSTFGIFKNEKTSSNTIVFGRHRPTTYQPYEILLSNLYMSLHQTYTEKNPDKPVEFDFDETNMKSYVISNLFTYAPLKIRRIIRFEPKQNYRVPCHLLKRSMVLMLKQNELGIHIHFFNTLEVTKYVITSTDTSLIYIYKLLIRRFVSNFTRRQFINHVDELFTTKHPDLYRYDNKGSMTVINDTYVKNALDILSVICFESETNKGKTMYIPNITKCILTDRTTYIGLEILRYILPGLDIVEMTISNNDYDTFIFLLCSLHVGILLDNVVPCDDIDYNNDVLKYSYTYSEFQFRCNDEDVNMKLVDYIDKYKANNFLHVYDFSGGLKFYIERHIMNDNGMAFDLLMYMFDKQQAHEDEFILITDRSFALKEFKVNRDFVNYTRDIIEYIFISDYTPFIMSTPFRNREECDHEQNLVFYRFVYIFMKLFEEIENHEDRRRLVDEYTTPLKERMNKYTNDNSCKKSRTDVLHDFIYRRIRGDQKFIFILTLFSDVFKQQKLEHEIPPYPNLFSGLEQYIVGNHHVIPLLRKMRGLHMYIPLNIVQKLGSLCESKDDDNYKLYENMLVSIFCEYAESPDSFEKAMSSLTVSSNLLEKMLNKLDEFKLILKKTKNNRCIEDNFKHIQHLEEICKRIQNNRYSEDLGYEF